jgi:hypothetical protein
MADNGVRIGDLLPESVADFVVTMKEIAGKFVARKTALSALASLVAIQALAANTSNVATLADISSSAIPVQMTYFRTAGCFTPGDGAQAILTRMNAAPPVVKPYHFQSSDGAWWIISDKRLNTAMFGCRANNQAQRGTGTNDAVAFQNFHDSCCELNRPGDILAGHYRFSQQVVLDQGKSVALKDGLPDLKGTHIQGAGEADVTFWFDSNVPSPCFKISSITGAQQGDGQRAVFYGGFGGVTIEAATANGVAFQIGEGNTLPNGNTSCYQNGFTLYPMVVANRVQSVSAVACLFSGLVTCDFHGLTANGGGVPAALGGTGTTAYCTAIRFQHCGMIQGNRIAVGNAKVGLDFDGLGSIHGITIDCVDFEVLETCVRSDNPNLQLTVGGGTMTGCDWMFDVTHSQMCLVHTVLVGDVRKSIIKNPNGAVGVYGGFGVILDVKNVNLVGVERIGNRYASDPEVGTGPNLPTQPPVVNNGWIKNGPQPAEISVFGADNPGVTVSIRDWFDFSSAGNTVAIGPFPTMVFRLAAGESMKVNSPNTWNWLWRPGV